MLQKVKIAIVGAGAAGCFCAVNIAEMSQVFDITVFEANSRPLQKLSLTGGGRCNITNTFEGVKNLKNVYSRGANLMKKLFYTFDYNNTVEWFENHGVELFAQPDGRVFPRSENAMQVVDTLLDNMHRLGIRIKTSMRLTGIVRNNSRYLLSFDNNSIETFDIVIVATGGSNPSFLERFANMGLAIENPVPSLFTFTIKDKIFNGLMGVTIDNVTCSLASTKYSAQGSLLVTHWGVSGPAVLKLSSFAARYLNDNKYTSMLIINWLSQNEDEVRTLLTDYQRKYPQRQVVSLHPQNITNRLWAYLIEKCEILPEKRWCEVSKKSLNRLVSTLISDNYKIQGKGHYKEEFVTCGGVSLSSVDSSSLRAKVADNLYFAGEVLDIDAVTGGFNLQAAWTTGYTVATSVVSPQNNQN